MRLPFLTASDRFPSTSTAWPEESDAPGLLAAGADLSVARLCDAYRQGIYPWFSEGQPILWWSPEPRMVLDVHAFRCSQSLRKTIRKAWREGRLEIRFDGSFHRVINACAQTRREGQSGTWIVPAMVAAYGRLHEAGFAHCIETWLDGELAGGLYFVSLGRMVFGESMFMHRTDASKIALAALVAFCRRENIRWIDCQQQTRHLGSLGASPVPRAQFEALLDTHTDQVPPQAWTFDASLWDEWLLPISNSTKLSTP